MVIGTLHEVISSSNQPLYFYHLVPKGVDMRNGLLSPYAVIKLGLTDLATKSLDKYRDRLVNKWKYYNQPPESLTNQDIMNGLDRFRQQKDSSRTIYFFRFPPYKELGPNMAAILVNKDIYRININDTCLQRHIESINWGYHMSCNDNIRLNKEYYEDIVPQDYFADYDDSSKDRPLFAPINHIGVVFKDGICPKKFLEKVN